MVLSHTTQQTFKYLQVCAQNIEKVAPAAIWILDYFLTFEREVRLFSNMSCWNIVTVMFILARYAPVIWIITEIYRAVVCQSLLAHIQQKRYGLDVNLIQRNDANGLLLVRILALWNNNRKIKLFLLASYLLIVVAMVICDILLALLLESICVPTSAQMVSDFTKMEHLIMGKFGSAALFELIVITLTMYHSIRLRSDGIRSIGRVASTLLKGSLLYALSLLVISIMNIVSLSLPASSQEQGGIIVVFQGVLHGVLASRVLFDLRDLGDAGQVEEHDYLFTSFISLPRTQPVSPMTVSHAESNA
ncbi:uncharacterized protein HD556DRAFT_1539911 [Suillus plorans]|uniref:DUF6533 domain-containing protein n=1 Tax=Suillus plorans TaxID=116603 RepID=A0A9P7DA17_9AGAM|nr:uncharacterized protein HD556DRAFT_1539911 [Suillus plorans]KAG1785745.1 hypothetical protein HD556DRAFT_1539911 [Suillus plorans]